MAKTSFAMVLPLLICQMSAPIACTPGTNSSLPKGVMAAIQKLTPGAKVIQSAEVDSVACKPVGESPGIVRADLNGDARDDFAVLLKTGATGRQTAWEGKTLREYRFLLAFFIDDGSGGVRSTIVRRYTDYLPTSVVLDLQAPGTLHDMESQRDITLKSNGVTLSLCEKSSVTYYLVGGKVRSISISD